MTRGLVGGSRPSALAVPTGRSKVMVALGQSPFHKGIRPVVQAEPNMLRKAPRTKGVTVFLRIERPKINKNRLPLRSAARR